jgi:CheY-like chemotaxis protein/anti-sigma regulatory factor (Ser/Thr protein kinase)
MPTILVVDDSAVDRRLVGRFLQDKLQCTVEFAATALEALARMDELAPDLVITDLTMPEMDGLELVTAMRVRHPDVPAVLMTAYGSETLALKALDQGAASYVPKAQLAEKLLQTVGEVLSRAHAARSHELLMTCLVRSEFSFCLESDPALIDPLVDLVQKVIAGVQLCDFTGRLRIGVALKQALLNALFHGSLELNLQQMQEVQDKLIEEKDLSLVEQRRLEAPYGDRRIFVDVSISPDEARLVIRDEGPGFDVSAVPDSREPGVLEQEQRRGLMLMRTFMDEVTFNDRGNQVTMVKRKDSRQSK